MRDEAVRCWSGAVSARGTKLGGIAILFFVVATAPGVGQAAPAPRGPTSSVRAKYQQAAKLVGNGAPDKALAVIGEGLAAAPADLQLLRLKGSVMMTLHDWPGALAAYQAYIGAGATGAKKRQAEELVKDLLPVATTFLDITVANGPATIYLPMITKTAFCTAAPSCPKIPLLPRSYQVLAERPGFERWSGRVSVANGQVAALAITLAEQASPLTVRATPPDAQVTVDDAAYDPTAKVGAGAHRIVVKAARHAEARREVSAHEGQPIEIDVALNPVVPIQVTPPSAALVAALVLDGKPIHIADGTLELAPGEHTLVARARGFQDGVVKIPAARADDYAIALDLAPLVPEAVVKKTEAAPPPAAIPASVPGRFTLRRKVALAAGAGAAAALAAGIVLGLQANQLDRDAYKLCPLPDMPCRDAPAANSDNQSARTRALEANLAYGVAGGAAIAAAVLWLTGAPESRVAVNPRLGSAAGLDLGVRF
jgi:hypothetical protein